jgi:hypothetical protein
VSDQERTAGHQPQVPVEDDAARAAWLREQLGRRMLIVVLAPAEGATAVRALGAALAMYPETRVVIETQPGTPSGDERLIAAVCGVDPDVVLVGVNWGSATDPTAAQAEQARATLRLVERVGLCDRAFVALLGPGVSRSAARRLGYEDGFAADVPAAAVCAALAREAVARDELRRHGSSPPCYL